MNRPKLNLWVTVALASIAPHVVEPFAPSHSNDYSIPTASSTIFTSPSDNNNGGDINDLSIEELRNIARTKGYDTVGMERSGLEMIVTESWWPRNDVNFPSEYSAGSSSSNSVREMEEELDTVPSSYNRLKNLQETVNADLGMSYDDLNSSRNGNENSQPQNQSQQPNFRSQDIVNDNSQPQNQSQLPNFWPFSSQSPEEKVNEYSQPQNQSQQPNLWSQSSQQAAPPDQSQFQPQSKLPIISNSKSESLKASVVGFFTGIVAVSPVTYLHINFFPSEIINNESSQFLFDTVTGGVSAAAFATIYQYFIQPYPTKNEDLKMSIVGAFVVCRSFSRIIPSPYCDGLICGAPLGFMDWDMLQQYALNFLEDLALFGAAAMVLQYACEKGFISYAPDPRKNLE